MLSAWREAKISGHCLKPVFFFPVNDENWLTETHPYLRLSLNPFFQWSSYRVAIFQRKGEKKLSCFSFPVYHYLWTQHQCRQSSINYAWNFLGSLIFFSFFFFFFFDRRKKKKNAFKVKNTQNQWSNWSLFRSGWRYLGN